MKSEGAAVSLAESAQETITESDGQRDFVVQHASWLAPDVLFLTLTIAAVVDARFEAFAECGETTVPLAARDRAYPPTRSQPADVSRRVAVLNLPSGHTFSDGLCLTLRVGDGWLRLTAPDLQQVTVSVKNLLRSELAAQGPAERANLLAFIVEEPRDTAPKEPASHEAGGACCPRSATGLPSPGRLQLSHAQHAIRQALRERLPTCVISAAAPQGMHVDAVLAIDERNFYVRGWLRDVEAPLTRLTAVSPEGCRTEILSRLWRHPRPDVEQFYGTHSQPEDDRDYGWIVHVMMSTPSLLAHGWTFEMGNAAGTEMEVSGPAVTYDPVSVRELILRDAEHERLPAARLRIEHIAPALTLLEERRRASASVHTVDQHGEPPDAPTVSVVVPLYGRIDFLEHQLAQFVHDSEFQRVDLLYVLDSPDLAGPFRDAAAHLAELYKVPFRAAVMSHNVGFAEVNNVGAGLARGRLLLLMNSDVLPSGPGWLSAMASFYDATPGIGALAPKLLYEDNSIQHAGLYFRRLPDTGLWNNEHYFKGLHRNLPAANVPRAVSAVTAACLMIDLTLYRELGGLRGMYVQGDYEDSDLCLRLAARGRKSWYLPTVELYHLEGQSYPSQVRRLTGNYNRWLHTHTWGDAIARAMEATDDGAT